MNSLLVAPAIMAGIGLFFGTQFSRSRRRFLKVDEDPRIEATNELLPGTNCGACGQPGCLPFAQKLVAGEVDPGQCTVSTDDGIEQIAEFLQVDVGRQEKLVARLRCAGGGAAGAPDRRIPRLRRLPRRGHRIGRRQRLFLGLPRPRRLRGRVHLRRHSYECERATTGRHGEMPCLPGLRCSLPQGPVRARAAATKPARAVQHPARGRSGHAALFGRLRRLR